MKSCGCCGGKDLTELKEIGRESTFVCNECKGIIGKGRKCPKCHKEYYTVEDHGDVTQFVHRKEKDGKGGYSAFGCVIPTVALAGFSRADTIPGWSL